MVMAGFILLLPNLLPSLQHRFMMKEIG